MGDPQWWDDAGKRVGQVKPIDVLPILKHCVSVVVSFLSDAAIAWN